MRNIVVEVTYVPHRKRREVTRLFGPFRNARHRQWWLELFRCRSEVRRVVGSRLLELHDPNSSTWRSGESEQPIGKV